MTRISSPDRNSDFRIDEDRDIWPRMALTLRKKAIIESFSTHYPLTIIFRAAVGSLPAALPGVRIARLRNGCQLFFIAPATPHFKSATQMSPSVAVSV